MAASTSAATLARSFSRAFADGSTREPGEYARGVWSLSMLLTRLMPMTSPPKSAFARKCVNASSLGRTPARSRSDASRTASTRSYAYPASMKNARARPLMNSMTEPASCDASSPPRPKSPTAARTNSSSGSARPFSSIIRTRPMTCRLSAYGSCEPVGTSPAEKQPTIESTRSATLKMVPAGVDGKRSPAKRGR